MENSINKYLHKKFKKQFGEIRNNNQREDKLIENNGINNTKDIIKEKIQNVINVVKEHQLILDRDQERQQIKNDDNSGEINTTIDNNNSSSNVPKESSSTNNLLLYNVNSNEKSSISTSSIAAATEASLSSSPPSQLLLTSKAATELEVIDGAAATLRAAGTTNVIKVNVIKKNDLNQHNHHSTHDHHHHYQQQQHHHHHQEECDDEFRSNNVQIISGDILTNKHTTTTTTTSTNGSISSIFNKVEGQIINDNNDINFDRNFKSNEPKRASSSITTDIINTTTTITSVAPAVSKETTNNYQTHCRVQEDLISPSFYVNLPTTAIEDISTLSVKFSTLSSPSNYDHHSKTTATTLTTTTVTATTTTTNTNTATSNLIVNKSQVNVNENNQIIEKSPNGKYVCPYCNLICAKPSVLQKHIRAHTNERPYPCESCGSRFKTRSNLYKHCRSRTHANRVMGNNKTVENNNEAELDNQIIIKHDNNYYYSNNIKLNEMNDINSKMKIDNNTMQENRQEQQQQQQHHHHHHQQQQQQHHQESISTTVITSTYDTKAKPYKPRFHTKSFYDNLTKENIHIQDEHKNTKTISSHINELITKNHYIVNTENYYPSNKTINNENVTLINNNSNNNKMNNSSHIDNYCNIDEPLNLSNKSRKRCLSEVAEPSTQKSLIKELLLKNLYASTDMQCPNCKMIFQTVTELDVHKHRSNCKGYSKTGARYSRSSSVNVASILTQNKNAFDGIPQLHETFFPLKSPGPFLGKTRLIESDKNKSFSFDDGIQNTQNDFFRNNNYKNLSIATIESTKRPPPVKLFGGEVKITHTSGETKSFKVDGKETESFLTNNPNVDYNAKLSENTVVKSVLQSGGTVLQNKTSYGNKKQLLSPVDAMNYQQRSASPNYHADTSKYGANMEISNSKNAETHSSSSEYTSIMDFSQKAVKSFTPNLKQLNLTIPGVPVPKIIPNSCSGTHTEQSDMKKLPLPPLPQEKEKLIDVSSTIGKDFRLHNPMTLVVNGKKVPYVPGMPGPVTAEVNLDTLYRNSIQHGLHIPIPTFKVTPAEQTEQILANKSPIGKNQGTQQTFGSHPTEIQPVTLTTRSSPQVIITGQTQLDPTKNVIHEKITESSDTSPTRKSTKSTTSTTSLQETPKKFARPNSLALKPTIASLKQHHGLTPTVFNQILISPDTPRVAKKYIEYQRNGYYFSNLGLKSSTKSVYCTLNKTQPYYVPHYKKLSMYSEWRQQDTKTDKLYVSAYDSRQKQLKFTVAGQSCKPLVVHSSYKFLITKSSHNKDDSKVNHQIAGGHESNEKYTYIRGRGRGRYVCDQCGIRCKKPSMLKKHIRTHTNDRPYTCSQCNFSFKTKGNLTKHMKCKSHNKNYYGTSSGSSCLNQPNSAPTSESDTDDSGMDSSDESTRQHEAAYGLLSLSQKPSTAEFHVSSPSSEKTLFAMVTTSKDNVNNTVMDNDEIVHVSKHTFAKNKILDHQQSDSLNFSKKFNNVITSSTTTCMEESDGRNVNLYLGKSNFYVNRPLTYPYTSPLVTNSTLNIDDTKMIVDKENYTMTDVDVDRDDDDDCEDMIYESTDDEPKPSVIVDKQNMLREISPLRKEGGGAKKTKFIISSNEVVYDMKAQKQDVVMDLSVNSSSNKENGDVEMTELPNDEAINYSKTYPSDINKKNVDINKYDSKRSHYSQHHHHHNNQQQQQHQVNDCYNTTVIETVRFIQQNGDANYISEDNSSNDTGNIYKRINEYDNSAMETLADIATKQMKLEKNSIAKNVATEFLKLATKNDGKVLDSLESNNFISSNKDVNDLIAKREENKSCTICSKNFSKPSQLRLHMNIHYLERPFRCDSCSVGFRTKGLLQKHERSAGHHNKLSTSPALSSSEPRPFKCSDCNVAFRIHGHLAKHLRSKMHIMKLECLAKIPFGLYAELERSNSLLTEINTSDGEQCLESLKNLAKKVFVNDPNKTNQTKGSSSVM